MLSGVISFYNFFTTTPKGKIQVNVCLGTACYVNGAEKVLQEFEQVLASNPGRSLRMANSPSKVCVAWGMRPGSSGHHQS
jgi:NADH:ubiquinone oxidoreductase subunit E